MRIVAIVSQVPDAEERLTITSGKVDLSRSKLSLDTMDEYGVEQALRLREAGAEAEVVVLAVGTAKAEEALRATLAMGADRGVLVATEEELDVLALSAAIANVVRTEEATLVLCGGQNAASDSQALGAAVAERLGWPQATWTTALTLADGVLTGKHDVDEGMESFTVALPAVITTQQGLNDPRYPTLPNIMKARKKEIRRESLESLGVKSRARVVNAEIQSRKRLNTMVEGSDAPAAAAQLVNFLRNEAKVIQ